MKRLLIVFFLFAVPAFGQGMRYDNFVLKPLAAGGVTPVSGALITVCTSAGTGTPCTPKVANIFSDEALTQVITGTGGAGTTNSDANGNFGFYLAPGSYIVTVTGSGITSYTIKLVAPVGLATVNTFSGGITTTTLTATGASTLAAATLSGLLTANAGITSTGPNALSGGGSLAGTYTGNPTLNGNPAFSGNPAFTGAPTVGKLNGECIIDGTQNATLAAAITCAGSSGVIRIMMFAVPSFTTATIPVGVTTIFDGPSCLNNSGTLTINGPLMAPPVQIFCGAGTVVLGPLPATNGAYPQWWGAKCDNSTDDLTPFQTALTVLNAASRSSRLLVTGNKCLISGQLVMDGFIGVTIEGVASTYGGFPAGRENIVFTGSSAPLISFSNSQAITFKNIYVTYNNAAMTGAVFEAGPTASVGILFENMTVGGGGSGVNASPLISLNNANDVRIIWSSLFTASVYIRGSANNTTPSTVVKIEDSIFNGGVQNVNGVVAIQNPQQQWTVIGNDFEIGNGTGLIPVNFTFTPTLTVGGFNFIGNFFADSGVNNTQTYFTFPAVTAPLGSGFNFHGNQFGLRTANSNLFNFGNNNSEINISGNTCTNATMGTYITLGTGIHAIHVSQKNCGTVSTFLGGSQPLSGDILDNTGQLKLFGNPISIQDSGAVQRLGWSAGGASTFVSGNGTGQVFMGSASKLSVVDTTGEVRLNGNMLITPTAPTIAAGGCGGAAASVSVQNGTAAFKINVGTTPGSACTFTMPAATTGWNCYATDITTSSTSVSLQKQTGAESTTSVTITNFSDVTVATAFVANDILKVSCHAD